MESSSSFVKRFVLAPIIFIIILKFTMFFMHMLEINDNMYYIMGAIMSLPLFLYMVMG
jgi:hypothetical protein